jgi:predicted NodU family carbamoyl transferase
MRVLGLNLSNNGSICIVDDGQVDFYLEAERITRKKRDYNIKPLLKFVDNVDAVAISDSFYKDDVKNLINTKDISSVKRTLARHLYWNNICADCYIITSVVMFNRPNIF